MDASNFTVVDVYLRLEPFQFSIYLLAHSAVIFMALFGNAVVIVTIRKDRSAQTPNDIFLCGLAVADFLTGLIAVPAAIIARIVISQVTCRAGTRPFFFVPAFVFCAVSVGHLAALTIDRLIAVSLPLRYYIIMTKAKCKITLVIIWLFGIGLGSLPVIGGLKYPDQWVCGTTAYKADEVAIHSLIIAGFTPTMSAILLIGYARIFVIAKRHLEELSRRRMVGMDEGKVRYLESKSRSKATVTAVLVVLMFSICWFPISAKLIVDVIFDPPGDIQFIYQTVTELLAYSNSAINPIIYALRYRKYRKTFKVFLCICCPRWLLGNGKINRGNERDHVHTEISMTGISQM